MIIIRFLVIPTSFRIRTYLFYGKFFMGTCEIRTKLYDEFESKQDI